MSFDFPSSPTEGQMYAPSGGPVYVYNAPAWRMVGTGSAAVAVIISDNAPATPVVGLLWFDSSTANLYVWYDDGSSQQWVQLNSVGT